MAFTNFESKEIHCKILYIGAKGSGKTENLRALLEESSPELRGGVYELKSLAPNPYFDFLPLSLGYVNEFHLKCHLYAARPLSLYPSMKPILMSGLDGFVKVYDSRIEALEESIKEIAETEYFLRESGLILSDLAQVIQYNKRDLADLVPLEILKSELNPLKKPDVETVASAQKGTMSCFKLLIKQILDQLIEGPKSRLGLEA